MTTTLGYCTQTIFSNARWDFEGHTCSRKAKVVEDGKRLCSLHSAAGQAKKEQKSQEKMAFNRAIDLKRFDKLAYDRAAGDYCRAKGLTIEELA